MEDDFDREFSTLLKEWKISGAPESLDDRIIRRSRSLNKLIAFLILAGWSISLILYTGNKRTENPWRKWVVWSVVVFYVIQLVCNWLIARARKRKLAVHSSDSRQAR